MNQRIAFLFFLSLFLFSSLNSIVLAGTEKNNSTDSHGLMILTDKNNGQEIELKKGELFQIELPQLGGAGYSWNFEKLNPEYLEMVSRETKPIDKERLGGPVLAIWLLRAQKNGTTEVTMDHYRLWEGKDKAINHFGIKLLIR
jgi:predicted secreted protein